MLSMASATVYASGDSYSVVGLDEGVVHSSDLNVVVLDAAGYN